jgi:hypothetical protein
VCEPTVASGQELECRPAAIRQQIGRRRRERHYIPPVTRGTDRSPNEPRLKRDCAGLETASRTRPGLTRGGIESPVRLGVR